MAIYHKSTPAYRDWIFWTLCVAAAVVFYFALTFKGNAQTNDPPTPVAIELTPQIVEQHLYAWGAVLLIVGGFIRHYVGGFITWLTPFGKAHGGVIRGIRDWFWDADWKPLSQPPKLVLTGTGTEQKLPPA